MKVGSKAKRETIGARYFLFVPLIYTLLFSTLLWVQRPDSLGAA